MAAPLHLRALIEMISILPGRLMTDELAAAGAFDKHRRQPGDKQGLSERREEDGE